MEGSLLDGLVLVVSVSVAIVGGGKGGGVEVEVLEVVVLRWLGSNIRAVKRMSAASAPRATRRRFEDRVRPTISQLYDAVNDPGQRIRNRRRVVVNDEETRDGRAAT